MVHKKVRKKIMVKGKILEDPSWSIYLFYNNNIYNSKHYKYGENTIHLDILSEKVIERYPDTIFKLIEIK